MATNATSIPPTQNAPAEIVGKTVDNSYELKPNEVMIITGHSCGKPSTPQLSFRPDNKEMFENLFGPIWS